MNCDTNKTCENDDNESNNQHVDLEHCTAKEHNEVKFKVGDIQNKEVGRVSPVFELILSTLTHNNRIELQNLDASELNKSFNNPFEVNDNNSDLDELFREISTEVDEFYLINDSISLFSGIEEANAISLSQDNATMHTAIGNYASELYSASVNNNADINDNIEATTITMPILPESSIKKGGKRKHDKINSYADIDEELNAMLLRMKYNRLIDDRKKRRTCVTLNAIHHDGDNIKKAKISDEDIKEYEEFKNSIVICCVCRKEVSFSEIFLVEGNIICNECVKEEEIDTINLKDDVYDFLDYTGDKLYKCDRVSHAKPLYQFMKKNKKGEWKINKNCCYCLLYKSQEYALNKY